MPVPVPRLSKPCAHPVLKPHNRILPQTHQNKNAIANPSTESTPSFALGDNWLPARERTSWRSSCDNDSIYPPPVQDFFPGLTASGNAAVIKGAHAEAYIPPIYNLLKEHNVSAAVQDFVARKFITNGGTQDAGGFTGTHQVSSSLHHSWNTGQGTKHPTTCGQHVSLLAIHGDALPACPTPILEDHSPGSASGPDAGSSPLEPLTPFTDFVDRAVGATGSQPDEFNLDAVSRYREDQEISQVPTFPTIADIPKQQEQVTTTPTASSGYKKLVEPLSEWIANYIWRVCTTGYSLPHAFKQTSSSGSRYAAEPPTHLASCIQSILLATLLQPSAIYLSLWYIVRLPVYFDAAPLGANLVKAASFQAAFLGDYQTHEREANVYNAPLRLIVLGFMLANKWLDDHTFSNKTWHTISSIPVQTLNALESRALDTFSYDLSISNSEWAQWLAHVMAYHISLVSPSRPQPISRPSSNPHTIIRRAVEEIIKMPIGPKSTTGVPQPVFVGFEERLREKEVAMAVDILEIDLDEDGPLREEYLPKRRASKITCSAVHTIDLAPNAILPPPAKWSPAADEPIHIERSRSSSQYVAVQAPQLSSAVPAYPLQAQDATYSASWLNGASCMPVKQIGYASYEIPFIGLGQPFYENATMVLPHMRSHSLSYDEDNLSLRTHMRSYSQSAYGRYDDVHMAVCDHSIPIAEMDTRWVDVPHYPYSRPYFPLPAIGLHPSW